MNKLIGGATDESKGRKRSNTPLALIRHRSTAKAEREKERKLAESAASKGCDKGSSEEEPEVDSTPRSISFDKEVAGNTPASSAKGSGACGFLAFSGSPSGTPTSPHRLRGFGSSGAVGFLAYADSTPPAAGTGAEDVGKGNRGRVKGQKYKHDAPFTDEQISVLVTQYELRENDDMKEQASIVEDIIGTTGKNGVTLDTKVITKWFKKEKVLDQGKAVKVVKTQSGGSVKLQETLLWKWVPFEEDNDYVAVEATGEEKVDSFVANKWATFSILHKCETPNNPNLYQIVDVSKWYLKQATVQQVVSLLCHPFRSTKALQEVLIHLHPFFSSVDELRGCLLNMLEKLVKCPIKDLRTLWSFSTVKFLLHWIITVKEDWDPTNRCVQEFISSCCDLLLTKHESGTPNALKASRCSSVLSANLTCTRNENLASMAIITEEFLSWRNETVSVLCKVKLSQSPLPSDSDMEDGALFVDRGPTRRTKGRQNRLSGSYSVLSFVSKKKIPEKGGEKGSDPEKSPKGGSSSKEKRKHKREHNIRVQTLNKSAGGQLLATSQDAGTPLGHSQAMTGSEATETSSNSTSPRTDSPFSAGSGGVLLADLPSGPSTDQSEGRLCSAIQHALSGANELPDGFREEEVEDNEAILVRLMDGFENSGKLEKPGWGWDNIEVGKISRQLSLVQWMLVRKITPREFMWWTRGAKDKCKNIKFVIDHFNWLADWIMTEVCVHVRLQERVVLLRKFVQIGKALLENGNFFGSTCVVGALRRSPIVRLAKSFATMGEEWNKQLEVLISTCPLSADVSSYRELYFDGPGRSRVPFLGAITKDLLFLNDGNHDKIGDKINWTKFSKMGGVITKVQMRMGAMYEEHLDENIAAVLIRGVPALSTDDAFKWSRRVEPKDSEIVVGELILSEEKLRQENEELRKQLAEKDELIQSLEQRLSTCGSAVERVNSNGEKGERKDSKPPLMFALKSAQKAAETYEVMGHDDLSISPRPGGEDASPGSSEAAAAADDKTSDTADGSDVPS
eukprot:CAMPEP_0119126662 /NCGR_PEP_ID=MMETSP1310-20130426/5498_1 /TAXON_ID=464262 /ORGANISM="Genus nov. species nov., Strain RCC2339" /LENGTH=1019 /DNA_ID=CAMNT_0007116833 /DNA_START=86 /DNA_END=3145 /DNA_ORIENTATION=+